LNVQVISTKTFSSSWICQVLFKLVLVYGQCQQHVFLDCLSIVTILTYPI